MSAAPIAADGPSPPGRRRRLRGIPRFVVVRTLLGVLTLLLVSVVIFAATQVLPGDAARSILGTNATPESLQALREQLGLDRSATSQYVDWLTGIFRGDLGVSLSFGGEPVAELIGARLVNSAALVFLAALISTPLALLIAARSAIHRDGPFDHVSSIVMLVLTALPEFVVAILLVVLLGTTVFHVLPAVSLIPEGEQPWDHVSDLVMPTLVLIIAVLPYTVRIMRGSMVETLETDYVEMARLKGLPERIVTWRHAAPNAVAPTIQVSALNLAYLAGGVVVVEYVFAYPGIGTLLIDAVTQRNIPVVQALSLLIAAVYVVVNVVADILTLLVSPRQRTLLR